MSVFNFFQIYIYLLDLLKNLRKYAGKNFSFLGTFSARHMKYGITISMPSYKSFFFRHLAGIYEMVPAGAHPFTDSNIPASLLSIRSRSPDLAENNIPGF